MPCRHQPQMRRMTEGLRCLGRAPAEKPTRHPPRTIQLVRSSLAKAFNFFSSVEARSRNSFMTL
jgi:hypothetical protein